MRLLLCLALLLATPVLAAGVPEARDTAIIQDCVKVSGADTSKAEACIGRVANPCLDRDDTRSTADQDACIDRERKVSDDILNETFRRLRDKLDETQKGKLREMQRAWIASRDKSCAFYWDFFQGTMASPMGAFCVNRETGRRALFLLGFLNDTDDKTTNSGAGHAGN
jgi:uncharacterized protein YecT (DUF1311 family)